MPSAMLAPSRLPSSSTSYRGFGLWHDAHHHSFTSRKYRQHIHTRYPSEESDITAFEEDDLEEPSIQMGRTRRRSQWRRGAQPPPSNSSLGEEDLDIMDIDKPLDYNFKIRDQVWIRTSENNWYHGVVVGQHPKIMPLASDKSGNHEEPTHGAYYMVEFRICNNIRKYFAPLNGEIKPDTEEVRQLLREGKWL
ncbi:hypothetical protein CC2G_001485 [Coprinopsis cinerea AmutBmut pab1-1]|nr:hypothetical protein CC2G_001485 [Coprinopsis cinerea AmutBmut pab1-1]